MSVCWISFVPVCVHVVFCDWELVEGVDGGDGGMKESMKGWEGVSGGFSVANVAAGQSWIHCAQGSSGLDSGSLWVGVKQPL